MSINYDQRDFCEDGYAARKGRKKNNKAAKVVIFAMELLVIAVMAGILWMVTRVAKPDEGGIYRVDFKPGDDLKIPEPVKQNAEMKGYMNIALFGVDISNEKTDMSGNIVDLLPAEKSRKSGLEKGFRSDTIMIASVNLDSGDIKLVSVYRDTLLNVGDTYSKCNSAYSTGGVEKALKMLNSNLDMNIKDFVTVSYWALSEVIDSLGGVYIDVDKDELKHLNNYGICIGKTMNVPYIPLAKPGKQLVNGIQAAAYCRIRYVGNDFVRTQRQQEVIQAIEEQAKKADLNTLLNAFNQAQDDICTSLKTDTIIPLLKNIAKYRIVETGGFPKEDLRVVKNLGAKGSCVVPTDLERNVEWLHEFFFMDSDYRVTGGVQEYSNQIRQIVSKYPN